MFGSVRGARIGAAPGRCVGEVRYLEASGISRPSFSPRDYPES